MITTKLVSVHQTIEVKVDESKFTPEFMEEFRKYFYVFLTLEDHIKHLGWLYAVGIVDDFSDFIDGYGPPSDFGISFRIYDAAETEIIND